MAHPTLCCAQAVRPSSAPSLPQFLEHCQHRRYPAKSTIIFAGEKGESFYYIIRGTVTVVIEDDEGREMVGRVLKDLEEQGLLSVSGKTIVVFGTR